MRFHYEENAGGISKEAQEVVYVFAKKSDGVAMRKKGLSEVMFGAVMSLYDGAKTRVRMGSAYSEEFEVKVSVYQGSVLSPLLFAIVVDVITESARRGVINELLYADDLVLMSGTMEDLKEKILELEGCTGK